MALVEAFEMKHLKTRTFKRLNETFKRLNGTFKRLNVPSCMEYSKSVHIRVFLRRICTTKLKMNGGET